MHTNRITRHLSYANVIASLALFIALGGASYAAVAIPANSVGTNQLKKGAVNAAKLKRNAVSSAKVKDGSLQRGDFASGTLLQGPQGPQGVQGAKGDPGQSGAPGQQGAPGTARAFAFVDPTCSGPGASCQVTKARNIVGARRIVEGAYCVQVAAGIDPATSGAAAGVDLTPTATPEGNATAMINSNDEGNCGASEFLVSTQRITPATATATFDNGVAFWLLVP